MTYLAWTASLGLLVALPATARADQEDHGEQEDGDATLVGALAVGLAR